MPDTLKDQVFKRLEQLAAVANLSEADRIAYDRAVDSYYVSKVVESDIREEGVKAGRKEGIKEGILQTARRMKAMKLSVEQIMQATGLSEEEIRNNK